MSKGLATAPLRAGVALAIADAENHLCEVLHRRWVERRRFTPDQVAEAIEAFDPFADGLQNAWTEYCKDHS